jgi:hypothetical protein
MRLASSPIDWSVWKVSSATAGSGPLPQLETPDALLGALLELVDQHSVALRDS